MSELILDEIQEDNDNRLNTIDGKIDAIIVISIRAKFIQRDLRLMRSRLQRNTKRFCTLLNKVII